MKKNYSDELFPIVDDEGNVIGEELRSVCHNGRSMLLHPVVHLHVLNSSGELFLQKRSMKKDIQPGKWDTSVGGHVDPGETVENALIREAFEELGLENFRYRFLCRYIWTSPMEKELVNSFTTITEDVPVLNTNEIEEGRFWTLKEIKESLGKGIFTPNFEHEFNINFSG
jgi:isopentenyldiphosphate isomerase